MLRRSRISVRPNVRPSVAGRTGASATPQDAPTQNQEAREVQAEGNEKHTAAAVTNKSDVEPSGAAAAAGDTNDQSGEGSSITAAVQRRKRFSVKPKVAPRTCTSVRTPRSPAKAVSESKAPVSDVDIPSTSSQAEVTLPQGLRSPSRQKPSGESRQPKTQPKPNLPSPAPPGPTAAAPAEDPAEQAPLPEDTGKELENTPSSQAREVPPRPPDKVPPSLPEKEAIELSERAETLVCKSSKSELSLPAPRLTLSRLLNDPLDIQRLEKARKLRELLRQEIDKEKKLKKAKSRAKEHTSDPAKMTMRDLIYYLPNTNPMTSYLEETVRENESDVPPSLAREESPERAQEPEILPETASQRNGEEEEDEGEAEEDQNQPLMVPRVKVAEDGSLIIDEESLTVEVQRSEGPNPVEERDTVFERGTTTTYSSFRKGNYTKPWSSEETDMFFLAISMVGTDFSMICQLFPHRARTEIKNKFKKEERENAWRIDKSFRERRKLDLEYFTKLLEKVLEVQNNKNKKATSPSEKKKPTKRRSRKAKGKKAEMKLSDVEEEEEEEEEEQNDTPDLEEVEGEKENEDISNEGGTPVSTPKRKYKRKKGEESPTDKPSKKKMATVEKSKEQDSGEAHTPEDAEAALPEDHINLNKSEKTEAVKATKGPTIKPAQLSRGRAPKPLVPLGRKWGRNRFTPSTKPKDGAPDAGQESLGDGASTEEVDKDASPSRPAKERKLDNDDSSSEVEEDSTVKAVKPTRYGRMPKPTQHLNYPAKEEAHSSASESTRGSASPVGSSTAAAKPKPKCPAKKARPSKTRVTQESKKPKLVTLRASQSEYSDAEDENQWEAEEMEEEQHPSTSSLDSSAPVFVPMSLRSPQPVVPEVEETMEELDILANVPDVLGISQESLCPDASCKQAQDETGTAEPCEHQLDLLVDVIDFLSSDQGEVTEEESYNEAAQTLLTIGNLAHLSQSAQNPTSMQDHTAEEVSASNTTCSQDLEEDIVSKPVAQIQKSTTVTVTSDSIVKEPTQTVEAEEPENSATDNNPPPQTGDVPVIKATDQTSSKQKTAADVEPASQIESASDISEQNAPQATRRRISKVKPKPNLGRASGIARSKMEPMIPPATAVEESSTVAPEISRVSQTLSSADESASKTVDCGTPSLLGDTASSEFTAEPSVSHEKAVDTGFALQVESDAAVSDQQSTQERSHCFSKTKLKSNLDRDTRNTKSQSQSADEKLKSLDEASESGCTDPETLSTVVTESEVSPQSNMIDPVPVQDSGDNPAATVTATEELSQSQEEESGAGSACQSRIRTRKQLYRVKPKPNLRQTPRTAKSEPQPREDTVKDLKPLENPLSPTSIPTSTMNTVTQLEPQPTCSTTPSAEPPVSTGPELILMPSLELGSTQKPTEEFSTGEETKMEAEPAYQVDSSSECLKQDVPQKRRRLAKAKPNIGSSTRTTQSKQGQTESPSNVSSEKQPTKDNSSHSELKTAERLGAGESKRPFEKSKTTPAVTEEQFLLTDCVPENQSSDKPTIEVESTGICASSQCQVKAGSFPQTDHSLRTSAPTTESNVQTREDASVVSEPQSSGSTQSKVDSEQTVNSKPEPKESTQQPCIQSSGFVHVDNSEVTDQDALQKHLQENSGTNQTTKDSFQAAQCAGDNNSEPHDSNKSSENTPQTCRARLPKTIPGYSNPPPHPQPVHNTAQPKPDSGTCSEALEDAASHSLDSNIQEPVEGAPVQHNNDDHPPNNPVSVLDCVTQIPGISTQVTASPSTRGTQSYPGLTTHVDVMSEQVSSDPEESFFILSLTEIPVFPSVEEVGSVSEPLPYLSVTEAPVQLQSRVLDAPGGSLAGGGERGPCYDLVPTSMEEDEQRDLASVQDIEPHLTTCTSSTTKSPVDHRGTGDPQIQVSESLEAGENSEESEAPCKKQRLDTGRRAKLKVQPNTARKKQACKTLTDKEAEVIPVRTNTAPESGLLCPPAQAETAGTTARGGDEVLAEPQEGTSGHLETEKDARSRGDDTEDSSSEAQTQASQSTQPPKTNTRNRKPKGFLSFLSEKTSTAPSEDPQQAQTASQVTKVKPSRTGRKRAAPVPVTSTQLPEDSLSTSAPPAAPAQAEVSIIQSAEGSPLCPDPEPSTSLCIAQVPAAQQSGCVESSPVDEEPTSVTQYFLSNIFTEVDKG